MMKIMIVSDSHGMDFGIRKVVRDEGPFDMMIHLGDSQLSEGELIKLAGCTVEAVAGNNDLGTYLPGEKLIKLGKHMVLLIHGHTKGVNYGLERLINYGMERGADVVMFGHTHIPLLREMDGMTLLNPGSITLPRQQPRKMTWVLLEIDNDGEFKYKFNSI